MSRAAFLRLLRLAALVVAFAALLAVPTSCDEPGNGPGDDDDNDDGDDDDGFEAPLVDAGDDAFARAATLLMWGRRAASDGEHRVLVDLIDQSSRAEVLRAMAKHPDYIDRWAQQVYDRMGVSRIGFQANPACYAVSRIADDSDDLARYVRDNAPEAGSFGDDWTLADVTRSALVLDNLSVPWRVHLFSQLANDFVLVNPAADVALGLNQANHFQEYYLNRSNTCIACHNSDFAVVDHVDPALDRHWPIEGSFETALFGAPDSAPLEDLGPFFRRGGVLHQYQYEFDPIPVSPDAVIIADGCDRRSPLVGCGGCPCEAAVCAIDSSCCYLAWTDQCVALCEESGEECSDPSTFPDENFNGCGMVLGMWDPGCNGCACEDFVCSIDPSCCEESWGPQCGDLCRESGAEDCAPLPEPTPTLHPWGLHESCLSFEHPDNLTPHRANEEGLFIEDHGVLASVYDLETDLRAGINSLGDDGLDVGDDGAVSGQQAFAWLLAMNFVDQTWHEAFGARLTMPNKFPRNRDQRDTLEELTHTFVDGGWSLVDLLVAIGTHPWFNQAAPSELEEGGSPYAFPAVFDPYSPADAEPELRNNSVGDTVVRLDARVLRSALHKAMEWPELSTFPGTAELQNGAVLELSVGSFLKPGTPGFESTSFQALLNWEAQVAGCRDPADEPRQTECDPHPEPGCFNCPCDDQEVCELPGLAYCCEDTWDAGCTEGCRRIGDCRLEDHEAGDFQLQEDWIDRLVEEALDGGGATWADVLSALKLRLLGDGDLSDDNERSLLSGLIGHELDATLNDATDTGTALRDLCAVWATTPQFMLSGIQPAGEAGGDPAIYPGGDDYRDACEELGPLLGSVTCDDDGLSVGG